MHQGPRGVLRVSGAVSLALLTVWVHYKVKVDFYSPEVSGSVSALGNVSVGQLAPELSARDLKDREISLTSLRGRSPVLLDFWATWCGPCRMSLPSVQKLYEDFAPLGLEVIGVNQGEPREYVREFVTRRQYAFGVVIDEAGSIGASFGIKAIPTTVLIDKNGVVRWLHVGLIPDDKQLRNLIQQIIAE